MTAVRLAPSIVTPTYIEAILEPHEIVGEPSQFPLCRCGYRSLDSFFYRHIEISLSSKDVRLVSAELVKKAVRAAAAMAVELRESSDDPKLNSARNITARLFRLYLIDGHGSRIESTNLVKTVMDVLGDHRLEMMAVGRTGQLNFVCSCGARAVGDWAWEYHRLTALLSQGVLCGSPIELSEIAGALSAVVRALSAFNVSDEKVSDANMLVGKMLRAVGSTQSG